MLLPNLPENLFEQMPMGLVLFDRELRMVWANPSAVNLIARYTRSSAERIVPGMGIFDLMPGTKETLDPLVARAFARETVQCEALSIQTGNTASYLDAVFKPFAQNGRVEIILMVLSDATERGRRQARTRESETALRLIADVIPQHIWTHLPNGSVDYCNRGMLTYYGLTMEEAKHFDFAPAGHPDDQERVMNAWREAVAQDKSFETEWRLRAADGRYRWFLTRVVPLRDPEGQVIKWYGTNTDIQDRKQIEENERDHRVQAEALRDSAAALNSTLDFDQVLDRILESVGRVVPHDTLTILLAEDGHLRVVRHRGFAGHGLTEWIEGLRIPVDHHAVFQAMVQTGEPVVLSDIQGNPLWIPLREPPWIRSYVSAPIRTKGEIIGLLSLHSAKPNFYAPASAARLQAFADQAAIALQNARLLKEVQTARERLQTVSTLLLAARERERQLAALEERQRLARDLHDSVSQALYGIGMVARTARNRLEHDPQRAAAPLDNVLALVDAALAEMRAVIFDLRPESLETEGLVAALQKQAGYLQARYELEVQTTFGQEPALSLEVKEALYRIAQEALQNTIKHAHATRVELQLLSGDRGLVMEIGDNGTGFNTAQSFPGHWGLHTMRERTAQVGGTFEASSAPSVGTHIRVEIPL